MVHSRVDIWVAEYVEGSLVPCFRAFRRTKEEDGEKVDLWRLQTKKQTQENGMSRGYLHALGPGIYTNPSQNLEVRGISHPQYYPGSSYRPIFEQPFTSRTKYH